MTCRTERSRVFIALAALLGFAACANAQAPADKDSAGQEPAGSSPSTSPAATAPSDLVRARVIEVRGDAQASAMDPVDWRKLKVNDELVEGTQIRTGINASVKLQIGQQEPYTALIVQAMSHVYFTEGRLTGDSKKVRVGVGYGHIRAGVAEGGLKSDFTVDSPVATLSKKGTWNFGLYYERGTNHFDVYLLDRGLVDVLNKDLGISRELHPGEAVTRAMRRWLDEAPLRRNIPVVDVLGQSNLTVAFNRVDTDGLRVINPEGGQATGLAFSRTQAGNFSPAQQILPVQRPIVTPPVGQGPFTRPEGFFGTGRADELVSFVVGSASPLRASVLRPGLLFQRPALRGLLSRPPGRR